MTMSAQEEQGYRLAKLLRLDHDIDWLIEESVGEKQLGSFGMLLFIRGLKIIRANYGDKVIREIVEKVIDDELAKTSDSPRGWDSALAQWDGNSLLPDKGRKDVR